MLGLAYLRAGEPERARQAAEQSVARIRKVRGAVYPTVMGYAAVAEVLLELSALSPSDRGLARAARRAVVDLERLTFLFPYGVPVARRYRGQLRALQGRAAGPTLAKAAAEAEALSMPFEAAQAWALLARYSPPFRQEAREKAAAGFQALGCSWHLERLHKGDA
jgi:hypothetical protein